MTPTKVHCEHGIARWKHCPYCHHPPNYLHAIAYGIEAFFRLRFKRQILGRGINASTRTALYGACCCAWISGFQNYPKLNPAHWWRGLR